MKRYLSILIVALPHILTMIFVITTPYGWGMCIALLDAKSYLNAESFSIFWGIQVFFFMIHLFFAILAIKSKSLLAALMSAGVITIGYVHAPICYILVNFPTNWGD